MTTLNQTQGSMMGLAIGDALGATVQFKDIGQFEPMTDIIGGGCFNLNPGEWTDDTSLAYCLAKGLIDSPEGSSIVIADYFKKWLLEGYASCKPHAFDIGRTTLTALQFYAKDGVIMGDTSKWSQGNGGIMRLAPAVLAHQGNLEKAVQIAVSQSDITHAHPVCKDIAAYMAYTIWHLLNGATIDEVVKKGGADIQFFKNREWTEPMQPILNADYLHLSPPRIANKGWCVSTLETSLWGLAKMQDFRESLLEIVNLGDDADTVGAVFGQIAGASIGLGQLPSKWVDVIAKKNELLELSEQLFGVSNQDL